MPSLPLSLRVPPRVSDALDERAKGFPGGRSDVVRNDLMRYQKLIRNTQARLKREGVFSEAEQGLIIAATNGTAFMDYPEMLPAEVEDAMALEGLDVEWDVDSHALREKLFSLTPLEVAAVVDAIERFWASSGRGEEGEEPDIVLF